MSGVGTYLKPLIHRFPYTPRDLAGLLILGAPEQGSHCFEKPTASKQSEMTDLGYVLVQGLRLSGGVNEKCEPQLLNPLTDVS